LKELDKENTRLKELAAGIAVDNVRLKELQGKTSKTFEDT
jgi:hypothetical protein